MLGDIQQRLTAPNTLLPRRGCAAGHRGRVGTASGRGGGHPFAALAVGSRGVGKRKTLGATRIRDVGGDQQRRH
jgi:hypothetical protein